MQVLTKIVEHARQGRLGRVLGWWLLHRAKPLLRPFRLFHRILFRLRVGYWPHLRAPRSFNEKISWIKFNYRDRRLPKLQDKLAVRDYVREVAPELRIPQLYSVADNADEFPFDHLPDKCVIKSNHGCGQIIFFDRSTIDPEEIKGQCRQWLAKPHGARLGEWAYQSIPRKLFAEELLLDERGQVPHDYKVFVFNGQAQCILVVQDRYTNPRHTYYDRGWCPLHVRDAGYRRSETNIPPPHRLQEMIQAAERLAHQLPFIRVDLYEICSEMYFGELTLYPLSGMGPFEPQSFDFEFGRHLKLPGVQHGWYSFIMGQKQRFMLK